MKLNRLLFALSLGVGVAGACGGTDLKGLVAASGGDGGGGAGSASVVGGGSSSGTMNGSPGATNNTSSGGGSSNGGGGPGSASNPGVGSGGGIGIGPGAPGNGSGPGGGGGGTTSSSSGSATDAGPLSPMPCGATMCTQTCCFGVGVAGRLGAPAYSCTAGACPDGTTQVCVTKSDCPSGEACWIAGVRGGRDGMGSGGAIGTCIRGIFHPGQRGG